MMGHPTDHWDVVAGSHSKFHGQFRHCPGVRSGVRTPLAIAFARFRAHHPAIVAAPKKFPVKMPSALAWLILAAGCFLLRPAKAAPIPVVAVHRDADGVTLKMNPGTLKLEVFAPGIIRVEYGRGKTLPPDQSLAVIAKPGSTDWNVSETDLNVHLRTDELEVRVDRTTGAIKFYDQIGKPLLLEDANGGKSLTPNSIAGINTLRSRQEFMLAPGEAIYGLGQHQNGLMNYRGATVHLQQQNPGESAVPVLVSSQGYGVLWDNPAITDVSVGVGKAEIIPSPQLYTEAGQPGGLTAHYYRGENFDALVATHTDARVNFDWTDTPPPGLPHDHYSVRWEGFVEAKQEGTYLFLATSDDGERLWIDGKLVIDAWYGRPVQTDVARVEFAAHSRHRIRLEYFQATWSAVMRLAWELPANTPLVTWSSEAAETIDYYFMYGPALDKVVADYRDLTGAAPLFGKWAWGFWQCKEHYASQQEILDVVDRYRHMHIPLDGIIQDWAYWNPHPWGSHQFDTNRYPDVPELMRELHDNNVHMIISVWPLFDVGCSNWLELKNAGCLYPQVLTNFYPKASCQWYDAFNPIGRRIYWEQISKALFSKGIDGWWLDASEPELSGHWGEFRDYTTAADPGFKVFNAYPLMHTSAVYEGQRAETSRKRVFILTRSAYAGQQRNAAVTWSGDISGSWGVFAQQIPAGCNFSLSGIPYWNTDTGGFFGGDPADPGYAELFTRWFQFSAFCPMFRVHGTGQPKEMWRFGTNTENILIDYDQLRYHLMPYIYSISWMVTHEGYTLMRPLVMDFRDDTDVYDISDQYLFGPALMACPVTKPGAATRKVYLPTGASWTDFWTGKSYPGGQTLEAAAPIETLPLFVRAGTILPYGPACQYAMERDDPMELRVYRGVDGKFTLYEDEGDNYEYEKGEYSTISISWNETTRTLTIGQRQGSFPGMLKERTFRVVWVSPGHGTGVPSTERVDAVVRYVGKAVAISPGN